VESGGGAPDETKLNEALKEKNPILKIIFQIHFVY
jgi:hypothetical protein